MKTGEGNRSNKQGTCIILSLGLSIVYARLSSYLTGFGHMNSICLTQRARNHHGKSHANQENCSFDVVCGSYLAYKTARRRSVLAAAKVLSKTQVIGGSGSREVCKHQLRECQSLGLLYNDRGCTSVYCSEDGLSGMKHSVFEPCISITCQPRSCQLRYSSYSTCELGGHEVAKLLLGTRTR